MSVDLLEYISTEMDNRIEGWGETHTLQEGTVRSSDDGYHVSVIVTDETEEYGGIVTDIIEISDADVITTVKELFQTVQTHIDMDGIDVVHPHINVTPDGVVNVGMTAEVEVDLTAVQQNELAELLDSISPMIPSPDSLSTLEAHLSSPTNDTGWNDFTVYYATDTPHEEWADCESVEEYCQMVAEHNDNVTFEEMMEKDTYYGHTHLGEGKMEVVDWLRTVGDQHIDSLFSAESFDGRAFLSDVDGEFDGTLTLSYIVSTTP